MNRIIVFTGAGISEPSGVSTFRDKNGLWNNHKIDEICNLKTWTKNYELVHNFYSELREIIIDKTPNIAHNMVKEWQDRYGLENVINITQNIDDLFEKANVKNTIHVHGFLKELKCETCGNIFNIDKNRFIFKTIENEGTKCPKCNLNHIKPNIIFFGEDAPNYYVAKRIFNDIKTNDIVIIIGTLGNVFPLNHYIKFIKYSNRQRPIFIINNMEKSKYIDDGYFLEENMFYESCETAILKIDKIVKKHMKIEE